jgi:hypothetical protein
LHLGPKAVSGLHMTGRIYERICTYSCAVPLHLGVRGGSIYVANMLFREFWTLQLIEFLIPSFRISPLKSKFATDPVLLLTHRGFCGEHTV